MPAEDEHPQAEEEESDDQRIHNTNEQQGTGLVDERVDGRGNRPHPRRRILWAAAGAIAVFATSVVFLAGNVVRNGGPTQVASEEFRRDVQEEVEQQAGERVSWSRRKKKSIVKTSKT